MDSREEKDCLSPDPLYRSYRKRWLVLSVVVLLNVTEAMIWLTFTPVAYKAMHYYETNLDTINWLSIVFMASAIPLGILATVILETYGLKPALLMSSWFACAGSGLRIASTIETWPHDARMAALFTGQCITALGQSFSMYAPAKTASTWFPENQRTLATTFGAVANPIGVVLAGLVSPLFVTDMVLDCRSLLIVMFVPTAATAVFTTAVMTESKPKHPPSAGGAGHMSVFGKGIKELVCNKNYMVLVLTIGGAIGLYSTFTTLLEQFLCPYGYSDRLTGVCSAAMTVAGVTGAALAGACVDVTKQFSSTAKICFSATALGTIIFCIVFQYGLGYYILFLIVFIGFFSFGLYPLGVELGIESTYPVGVATSSGVIMISGQVQSIILVVMLGAIGKPMSFDETQKHNSTCLTTAFANANGVNTVTTSAYFVEAVTGKSPPTTSPTVYDLSASLYICAAYMAFLALIMIVFFRPTYLRMKAERSLHRDCDETKGYQRPRNNSSSSEKEFSDDGSCV